jgi:23S rRNA pseudouridine2605 synthase
MKKSPLKKNKSASSSAMSLSKYLALSGVCSRRKAVELIEKGAVIVNGHVIKEPGFKLTPTDLITANGQSIKPEEKIYILLNKPKDYISTVFDEKGRKTIMDLVRLNTDVRLYPVGRLDRSTTGLIVLTNDGELALKLSHPRYEVVKTYQVTLDKPLSASHFKKIGQEGVNLEDGHVDVDVITYVPGERKNVIMLDIHSGRNRIVRRIFEEFGYSVKKLDRIAYAGLTKQGLKNGHWRFLELHEVRTLKKS